MTNRYAYTNPFVRSIAKAIDTIGFWLFKGDPRRPQPNELKRAVLFRLDQIGDALYCTPLLDHLATYAPQLRIDIVTTRRCAPVFESHPAVGEIYTYDYPRFARADHKDSFGTLIKLAHKLRSNAYDLTIDPRGEPLVALLSRYTGARYRVGLTGEEILSFFYTHRITYNPNAPAWHRFKAILESLGATAPTWTPRIVLSSSEQETARTHAQAIGTFIGIHLGAGVPFKRWPLEYFAEVVKAAENHNEHIVVFGTKSESFLAEQLQELSGVKIYNMSGSLSLRETYGLIGHARAFVGNDSALVHFAAPQGVHTLHLMSSASPASAAALGTRIERLVGDDQKHHCTIDACPYPCPHMRALQPDKVLKKLW